jgi:hypothetical protein
MRLAGAGAGGRTSVVGMAALMRDQGRERDREREKETMAVY